MQLKYVNTVNFEYKNMLNRGNSGYNGHFTPDQTNFLMNKNCWSTACPVEFK